MTSRTILVVDDDDDLRDTLVEQLALYEEFDVLQEATAAKEGKVEEATEGSRRGKGKKRWVVPVVALVAIAVGRCIYGYQPSPDIRGVDPEQVERGKERLQRRFSP